MITEINAQIIPLSNYLVTHVEPLATRSHRRAIGGIDGTAIVMRLTGFDRRRNSAYRAHESGQNYFSVENAELYAKAYGVDPAWLLVGAEEVVLQPPKKPHKHNCVQQIYAIAILLRDEPKNRPLLIKLIDCAQSQIRKLS